MQSLANVENPHARRLSPLPKQWSSLAHAFLHQAKSRPRALAVVDSLGTRFTYQRLLIASLALGNELSKRLGDSVSVGILLPPSAGAVIANVAVMLLGKVAVNLNYSTGQQLCDDAVQQCRIKHIISSSKFLKRIGLEFDSDCWIDLDQVKEQVGPFDRIKAWVEADLLPRQVLEHMHAGLDPHSHIKFSQDDARITRSADSSENRLDEPATIIFTSGSTAAPKGVVLSHGNILSNIHAIKLQGRVKPGEVVLGVIPFFHSFGLTMTLWAPLCLGETVVYHYNPFDAKRISSLCDMFEATTLICTPTMMGSYLRRCAIEKFSTLKTCILGGEKLKSQQLEDFIDALGFMPCEGYGLAETSPVVSCNVPSSVVLGTGRTVTGTRPGTVGLPLPGTSIRVFNAMTNCQLPPGSEGMIQVKGPQVMLGYLNKPAETARVLKDGWFTTGDIGKVDADGFLTITGRISQFSKIAGEMVPHLAVEDYIMKITGNSEQTLSVTSAPDMERGERLVVAYSKLDMTPAEIVEKLRQSDISRLWIPEVDNFIHFADLPILPNGKLDLLGIRKSVAEKLLTSEMRKPAINQKKRIAEVLQHNPVKRKSARGKRVSRFTLLKRRCQRMVRKALHFKFPVSPATMLSHAQRVEIERTLLPGDILLESDNAHLIPQIFTKLFFGSSWTHSALYVGNGEVIDAGRQARVARISLDEFLNTTGVAVFRPRYRTYEDAMTVCSYASERVGAPFDTAFDAFDSRTLYCGQLIAEALQAMPHPIAMTERSLFSKSYVPPAAIANCPEIDCIWSSEPKLRNSLGSHWLLFVGAAAGGLLLDNIFSWGFMPGAMSGMFVALALESKLYQSPPPNRLPKGNRTSG